MPGTLRSAWNGFFGIEVPGWCGPRCLRSVGLDPRICRGRGGRGRPRASAACAALTAALRHRPVGPDPGLCRTRLTIGRPARPPDAASWRPRPDQAAIWRQARRAAVAPDAGCRGLRHVDRGSAAERTFWAPPGFGRCGSVLDRTALPAEAWSGRHSGMSASTMATTRKSPARTPIARNCTIFWPGQAVRSSSNGRSGRGRQRHGSVAKRSAAAMGGADVRRGRCRLHCLMLSRSVGSDDRNG